MGNSWQSPAEESAWLRAEEGRRAEPQATERGLEPIIGKDAPEELAKMFDESHDHAALVNGINGLMENDSNLWVLLETLRDGWEKRLDIKRNLALNTTIVGALVAGASGTFAFLDPLKPADVLLRSEHADTYLRAAFLFNATVKVAFILSALSTVSGIMYATYTQLYVGKAEDYLFFVSNCFSRWFFAVEVFVVGPAIASGILVVFALAPAAVVNHEGPFASWVFWGVILVIVYVLGVSVIMWLLGRSTMRMGFGAEQRELFKHTIKQTMEMLVMKFSQRDLNATWICTDFCVTGHLIDKLILKKLYELAKGKVAKGKVVLDGMPKFPRERHLFSSITLTIRAETEDGMTEFMNEACELIAAREGTVRVTEFRQIDEGAP